MHLICPGPPCFTYNSLPGYRITMSDYRAVTNSSDVEYNATSDGFMFILWVFLLHHPQHRISTSLFLLFLTPFHVFSLLFQLLHCWLQLRHLMHFCSIIHNIEFLHHCVLYFQLLSMFFLYCYRVIMTEHMTVTNSSLIGYNVTSDGISSEFSLQGGPPPMPPEDIQLLQVRSFCICFMVY